jgi:CubicO group peptidase (beta-lactamase class C family)
MAEQATGQPYDALLSSLVYVPLGLNETTLPDGFRLPSPSTSGSSKRGACQGGYEPSAPCLPGSPASPQ